MLKRFFENKRKSRFERMTLKVPNLSDNELKQWYSSADTQRLLGDFCEHETKLLQTIENELVSRGFEYQADF